MRPGPPFDAEIVLKMTPRAVPQRALRLLHDKCLRVEAPITVSFDVRDALGIETLVVIQLAWALTVLVQAGVNDGRGLALGDLH